MTGANTQIELLSKLLDAAELRHRVIAQNVANVNTPGYRRQDVKFEDALAQSLARGSDKALISVKPTVVEAPGNAVRADGNTVDIDEEMGQLSKNTILYRLYTQLLSSQLGTMRTAITGR